MLHPVSAMVVLHDGHLLVIKVDSLTTPYRFNYIQAYGRNYWRAYSTGVRLMNYSSENILISSWEKLSYYIPTTISFGRKKPLR